MHQRLRLIRDAEIHTPIGICFLRNLLQISNAVLDLELAAALF